MDKYEMYAGEDKWRGNYTRAQLAGRVIEPKVFPQILEALKLKETEEGRKAFGEVCISVMQDIPPATRDKLIRDMWAATWASRRLGDQVKSCW